MSQLWSFWNPGVEFHSLENETKLCLEENLVLLEKKINGGLLPNILGLPIEVCKEGYNGAKNHKLSLFWCELLNLSYCWYSLPCMVSPGGAFSQFKISSMFKLVPRNKVGTFSHNKCFCKSGYSYLIWINDEAIWCDLKNWPTGITSSALKQKFRSYFQECKSV